MNFSLNQNVNVSGSNVGGVAAEKRINARITARVEYADDRGVQYLVQYTADAGQTLESWIPAEHIEDGDVPTNEPKVEGAE